MKHLAGAHHVPVVVTDIWMEQVTGLELLALLCAISPRTKVIVITARENWPRAPTAMAIGPIAFFMKPFNDEKFIAAAAMRSVRVKFFFSLCDFSVHS